MPEYKVRYLVVSTDTVHMKQTIVERIVALNVIEAKNKAEEKANERTDEVIIWKVKAIEQI